MQDLCKCHSCRQTVSIRLSIKTTEKWTNCCTLPICLSLNMLHSSMLQHTFIHNIVIPLLWDICSSLFDQFLFLSISISITILFAIIKSFSSVTVCTIDSISVSSCGTGNSFTKCVILHMVTLYLSCTSGIYCNSGTLRKHQCNIFDCQCLETCCCYFGSGIVVWL